jgi:DNA-binding protein
MEKDRGTLFVGSKPFMNYVTGIMMHFSNGADKIVIKARGKYISRAVDIGEVIKNKFVDGAKVSNVKIGSTEFESREGRKIRTSTIELTVSK